ncbi:MAG: EthD domain-containing protein [Myxococcales bacterium]|nr:EthD domain-containing protein [Myxococcales bacterium]
MYKVVGLLKRPEGVEIEDFHRWWLEEHAEKVKKWPGLVRYCINLATTDDQVYDGVAEVWFDKREQMDSAFSKPEGQRARQSATDGSREIVILLTEEHVMVDG